MARKSSFRGTLEERRGSRLSNKLLQIANPISLYCLYIVDMIKFEPLYSQYYTKNVQNCKRIIFICLVIQEEVRRNFQFRCFGNLFRLENEIRKVKVLL